MNRESPLEVIGALGVGLSILIMLALMSPFIALGALMNRRHA